MLADLAAVLAAYPARLRPTTPPMPLLGGLSGARLWRFESAIGPQVARLWPPEGITSEGIGRIHAWILQARDLDYIPTVWPTTDDRTLVVRSGRIWEVMSWRPGSFQPHPNRDHVSAAVTGLAALHQRLAAGSVEGPCSGLSRRARELASLLQGGFDDLALRLARELDDRIRSAGERWLRLARERTPALEQATRRDAVLSVPLQPCLRDARPEHFLFQGNCLTGLIDFGAMGIDTVAADLARLLADWIGRDPALREVALAAYHAVRPLHPRELALVEAYDRASAPLVGAHWMRWHFLEGRTFEPPGAVAAGIARSADRLQATQVERWGGG